MIGKHIRQYEIREELGRGGMGVVYKAHDATLNRTVALKLVPEAKGATSEQRLRLLNEARAAAGLNHPNICTVYEVGEDAGVQFIAIEYVEGPTLREYIEKHRRGEPGLPVGEAAGIAAQIADALDEAHRRGIVHRDIKSENIMINARGQVKVMDFGLARLAGAARLTKTSSTVGTLAYMPPEAIQGGEVDARSDLFSLGAVLYEMVAGKVPFRGDHEASMMYSILNEDPVPLDETVPDVSPDLLHIINRSLEKDPADRYQSASDMAIELRRLKKETGRVTRATLPIGTSPVAGVATDPSRRDSGLSQSGRQKITGMVASSEAESMEGAQQDVARRAGTPRRFVPWIAAGLVVIVVAVVGGYLLRGRSEEGSGAAAQTRKMLVVLPFQNLGAPEMDYFADGMTEEITGKLAGLSGIGVIGRSSALQYRGTNKPLKEIGNELAVSYVLEGTVRWEKMPSGDTRVRVSPQLIRVSDATQVWSQPYEAVLSSVFTIQAEIAEKVAAALDVTLLADERTNLRVGGTTDTEAYDLFLRGNAARARGYAEREMKLAREMYSRALERDPGFAAAHASLASTLSDIYWFYYDRTPEIVRLCENHARKAVELEPREPLGPESMGWYFYHCKLDYDQALHYFREAIRLRPQHARAYEGMGAVNRRKGDFEESRRNYAEAVRLNPRDAIILDQFAETVGLMRKYDEAHEYLDRAARIAPETQIILVTRIRCLLMESADTARAVGYLLEASRAGMPMEDLQGDLTYVETISGKYESALKRLEKVSEPAVDDQFSYAPVPLLRAELLGYLGRADEARKEFEAARKILTDKIAEVPDDPRYHAALGLALAGLGRKEEAVRSGLHAVELLPIEREAWRGAVLEESLAAIYASVGEEDAAIDRLEKLLARPSQLSSALLKADPIWKSLRGNPRFQKLIRERA